MFALVPFPISSGVSVINVKQVSLKKKKKNGEKCGLLNKLLILGTFPDRYHFQINGEI